MKRIAKAVSCLLLLAFVCIVVAAPVSTGTRHHPLLGGSEKIKWLLRDEFTTALSAGSVNGTAAEPGPGGNRAVTDTSSKISIASNLLTFSGGTAADYSTVLSYSALSRLSGSALIYQINLADVTHYWYAGWDDLSIKGNTSSIRMTYGTNGDAYGPSSLGTFAALTNYYIAVICRTTGYYIFIKGGAFTNWTLLWVDPTRNAATVSAAYRSWDASFTSDFVRNLTYPWLPTTLLSDGFDGTWGTTDGLGHAEGVAGGLGAGGNGRAWLDGGAWALSGGYAYGTPVLGAELNSGNLVVGKWYSITATQVDYFFTGCAVGNTFRATAATALDANNKVKLMPQGGLLALSLQTTTDCFVEQVIHARTLGTQVGVAQSDVSFACSTTGHSAGSNDIALTSLSKAVTTNDTITIAGTIYTVSAVGAYSSGSQTVTLASDPGVVAAGAKIGVDWANWNGVLFYLDGAGNIKVDEVKAGVYTNRSSVAATFVADKRFIVRKIGTEYRWFFNEALVGSSTAVDAASQVGLYWGMFSTDATNTIDSMVIYASGSEGQYNLLNRFSEIRVSWEFYLKYFVCLAIILGGIIFINKHRGRRR